MTMIKVERRRNIPYTVNHESLKGGTITFSGSKNGKTDIKELPEETVNYLSMSTSCLSSGSLYIVDEKERKDIVPEGDLENSHSREEYIKLLNGNHNKLKSELKKIEADGEKQFVIEIAKEIKLDSVAKQKIICEWAGVKTEVVFDNLTE